MTRLTWKRWLGNVIQKQNQFGNTIIQLVTTTLQTSLWSWKHRYQHGKLLFPSWCRCFHLCFQYNIRVSMLIWFKSFCFRTWWRCFKILIYRGILWLSDSPDFLSRACKKGIKTGKDYCKYIWPDSKHQNTPSWNPKTGLKKFRIIFFSPKIDILISQMNFNFFFNIWFLYPKRTKTGRSRTDLF